MIRDEDVVGFQVVKILRFVVRSQHIGPAEKSTAAAAHADEGERFIGDPLDRAENTGSVVDLVFFEALRAKDLIQTTDWR